MLAEVFILRLEATLRTVGTQTAGSRDSRFVPIQLPVGDDGESITAARVMVLQEHKPGNDAHA
jgi:hypothetical protein